MIFREEPRDFNPRFSIVSCFCENDDKIILLQRCANKSQGLRWGSPAGKIEGSETPDEAILRELHEETGINLKKDRITYFGKVFVRYSEYDFIYHIFHTKLSEKTNIKIKESEHIKFVWATPKEALDLPLVQDLDACIKLFYNI